MSLFEERSRSGGVWSCPLQGMPCMHGSQAPWRECEGIQAAGRPWCWPVFLLRLNGCQCQDLKGGRKQGRTGEGILGGHRAECRQSGLLARKRRLQEGHQGIPFLSHTGSPAQEGSESRGQLLGGWGQLFPRTGAQVQGSSLGVTCSTPAGPHATI